MANSSFFKQAGTTSQLQGSTSASAAAALASEQAAALSETNSAASAAAALVSKNSAASSAASIGADATAAAASATASASSATTASGHATSTAADAVQTGLDSSSASASAAAALLSKNSAASDAAQVATDAAQVAADKVQTAADRVQTGQDVTASAASATSASSSQTASATSAAAALVSQNAAAASATTSSGHATSTAADAVQTAADAVQTGLDRTAAASSATSAASAQTGAETALDEFTDLYLGAKNTSGGDPTTDNDGDALQTGALMYDQTNSQVKTYSGSAWVTAAPTSLAFASLTGKPTTIAGYGITDAAAAGASVKYADGYAIAALNAVQIDYSGSTVIACSDINNWVDTWPTDSVAGAYTNGFSLTAATSVGSGATAGSGLLITNTSGASLNLGSLGSELQVDFAITNYVGFGTLRIYLTDSLTNYGHYGSSQQNISAAGNVTLTMSLSNSVANNTDMILTWLHNNTLDADVQVTAVRFNSTGSANTIATSSGYTGFSTTASASTTLMGSFGTDSATASDYSWSPIIKPSSEVAASSGKYLKMADSGAGLEFITAPFASKEYFNFRHVNGVDAIASGIDSLAIGGDSEATATDTIAIGWDANATQHAAVSIGSTADATGDKSIALGLSAQATHDRSVSIGQNSATTAADQIMLGNSAVASVRVGNSSYTPSDNADLATKQYVDDNAGALTSSAAGITLDNFTGNGSTTAFTVTDAPANANSLLVTINGITQRPATDYTTSGTTLTFTTAPFNGANISSRLVGGSTSGGGGGVNLNAISQSIIPDTDVTYDLGTSSSRFRDLYLSGSTLDLGGSTFSVDDTSGAVAIVPKPTSGTPNPTGVVVTNEGIVKAVTSTAGSVSASQIQTAASSSNVAPAMTVVTNQTDLPSNPSSGSMAYVTANNNLYIYNGSGWYAVAAVNQTPTISGANATYSLATDGTATVVTLTATDPEGLPITWSHTTSGLVSEATVTGSNNVFTITPSTNSSHAGSFDVTFQANDGVNIGTATSSFTLSFLEGDYFWIANSGQAVDMDNTSNVSTVFGSNISLSTKGSYAGYGGGKTQNATAGSSANALVVDLSSSGGFDATTDLIVFSFYLPSETGNTIGMGCYDDAAGTSVTLATGAGGFGVLTTALKTFSGWNNNGQWIIATFGGGNAINTFSGTGSSSGFRMWPVQTGSTLGTEISAATASGGGFTPPTVSQAGMVFWNGGDIGSYTAGYTARNAMEWYVRSFQVYYDQTTSGRTVEQIVGAHQDTVFT